MPKFKVAVQGVIQEDFVIEAKDHNLARKEGKCRFEKKYEKCMVEWVGAEQIFKT